MHQPRTLFVMAALLAALGLLLPTAAAAGPEDELAATLKAPLAGNFNADWRGIETLPRVRWAPLPPTLLQDCLPDGGCFTRQGQAAIAGRTLLVTASGARSFIGTVYLRNTAAPFGEAAVLAALQRAGVSAELARCPVPGSKGGINWYRLKGKTAHPAVLAVQSSCNGKPCEGFVLTLDDALPPLQPQQLRLYSEQCSGAAGGERQPVSTSLPHQLLASTLVALLPPAGGPALVDWKALPGLVAPLQWEPGGPTKINLSYKKDPNPYGLGGSVTLASRTYHLLASGSATQAQTIYFDEAHLHRPGEDLLGELRAQGLQVQLARCGPVYTESTTNWYRVTGAKTRPVVLMQAIRRDGKQLQDAYELRLDASLPQRDPRDRDPGVAGCR